MADDVLIVGGGIAGFGLARALSLRGVPCVVVERQSVLPRSGLGLNLPGNAVRALTALGLGDEVRRAGTPIRRREYRNESGRLLFTVDEDDFWGAVGGSLCLRRSTLLDILHRGAAGVRFVGAALLSERNRQRPAYVSEWAGTAQTGSIGSWSAPTACIRRSVGPCCPAGC